jgi:hypothetical protein
MDFKFLPIPNHFKINETVRQDNYLVNGKLVSWKGDFSPVQFHLMKNINLRFLERYLV